MTAFIGVSLLCCLCKFNAHHQMPQGYFNCVQSILSFFFVFLFDLSIITIACLAKEFRWSLWADIFRKILCEFNWTLINILQVIQVFYSKFTWFLFAKFLIRSLFVCRSENVKKVGELHFQKLKSNQKSFLLKSLL